MAESIILTGASGNLGTQILKALQEKFNIIATVRSESDAESLTEGNVLASVLDLTDEEQVEAFVDRHASSSVGAVLTAGGFAAGGFDQTDMGQIQKLVHLNFGTVYPLVRALIPIFEKNGGGQFVLIGARPALDPKAGHGLLAYSLSKGLIFQLSDMINAWGKGKNITSTVIVPSIIDTPPNRQAMPDTDYSNWVSTEAIAETIGFLFSESGKQIREGVIKMYNNS